MVSVESCSGVGQVRCLGFKYNIAARFIDGGLCTDIVTDSIDSTSELLSNEATPEETRARLDAMASEILERLLAENEDARTLYALSAGYAVFDTRRVSVFPVSAAYGRGVAVSLDAQRTYMNMSTGGVGVAFGIGGFETQFVILFETPQDLEPFINTGVDAKADWGLMAGESTESDTVRYIDGRSYYILSKTGWRVNANAEGTKFWKSPELN